jgi:ATP-dependent RNA helicase DeaD
MTDERDTERTDPDAGRQRADGFAAMGLPLAVLTTLAELGYEEPTPIQREAIPVLVAGRDLLAEAPTGTGKTAAFALPLIKGLAAAGGPAAGRREGRVGALILVPTRELAMQVSEAVHRYGERLGIRVLPIYGGQAMGPQLRSLKRGVDVVVATPGRAVDHVDRGTLDLGSVASVVLDEADEMLDMGFAEDLETLLSRTPEGRQTALFSATISPPIARIARRHLREPERISIRAGAATRDGMALIRQVAYIVRRTDKVAALGRILDLEEPVATLVFARTRGEVDELAERLGGHGYDAAALHGGLSQEQRDRIMDRFRSGELDVLVATDVAARGLDIGHVSHVVNFDVPSDPDAYVHRIGRTGRAGRTGVAITFFEPREHRLLKSIERTIGTRLELGRIPTIADLRERRLDLLRASLREAILEDGSDRLRAVVEPLTAEFDLMDIALAAVGLAERRTTGDRSEEAEIAPVSFVQTERPRKPARPSRAGRPASTSATRAGDPWVKLHVGAGRRAGLRPNDLVGAITGETELTGASIGSIQIADSYATVEVPESAADAVVLALGAGTIRGRKVPVRRFRER